ncbi:MAG: group 1 glycosyl transferase [Azospira oryzae]|nr:MAG: group 1 glycosyl transferase [Azospira oryzae]
MPKRILFICPYPTGEAPSQRFRFEQYFQSLQSNQIAFEIQPFLSQKDWRLFYSRGSLYRKAIVLLRGFSRRIVGLRAASAADFVFIHREAAPVGPPIFEWIIAKVFRKKIIYDFDDAIWLTDRPDESLIVRITKWRSKVQQICGMSYRVSCGNSYLSDFASQFTAHAVIIPTTIDTEHHKLAFDEQSAPDKKITIGWTGSHSTLKYLMNLNTVLKEIERMFAQVRFLVIADQCPVLDLKRLEFREWKRSTEVEDLSEIDIGIMPLPDDEWSKGKCGFKLLQYMALNIPAIAAPVGVNTKIIKQGENGFLCSSVEEWTSSIEHLIHHHELRLTMGQAGRSSVEKNYSVSSNSENFVSLFI